MAERVYLAVDLGASSGRVLAGCFDGQRIRLEEVHRFANGPVHAGDSMFWDMLALWQNISEGLAAAAGKFGDEVRSVGVDTWGVDFALLGRNDVILGNPVHYRDPRTEGMMDAAIAAVGRQKIFQQTGLQFLPFNTLFQLLAMRQQQNVLLEMAESFLMMPDLFHWLLTGEKSNEITNASTTQFYNPESSNWARGLLDSLKIPTQMLGSLTPPGTVLGPVRAKVRQETGLNCQVVLPGTHDTASAVVAVPADAAPSAQPNWCYISSGTWSLMGVESPRPVLTERCMQLNFTNEGGVGGTTRLLKNISGLWLLQECRRIWQKQGHAYDWEKLNQISDAAPGREVFINPDHASFMAPDDMPEAVRAYCRATGQSPPDSHGGIIRCCLESLAMRYRQVLEWLEELTSSRLDTIHIVGGGVQNERLCQATADACGRRTLAGPIEATALGNVAMQAIADGAWEDVRQARQIIGASSEMREYLPRETSQWDAAYEKFLEINSRES